jgi:hypothetical protein
LKSLRVYKRNSCCGTLRLLRRMPELLYCTMSKLRWALCLQIFCMTRR